MVQRVFLGGFSTIQGEDQGDRAQQIVSSRNRVSQNLGSPRRNARATVHSARTLITHGFASSTRHAYAARLAVATGRCADPSAPPMILSAFKNKPRPMVLA